MIRTRVLSIVRRTVVLGAIGAAPPVFAQTADTVTPLAGNGDLLQRLSSETQRLYTGVRAGIVRVQLPTPRWLEQVNIRRDLLNKWGPQLSPQVREQLIRQERPVGSPTTEPTMQPRASLVLLTTGMLIDGDGHAVVPLYVERSAVGDSPLHVLLGDGHVTTARYLGSDRKTNLTILQLAHFPHMPVRLSPSRPQDGDLTMVIAPDGSCRLVVWNSLHAESGLVVMPDGCIAGFGFDGRFLGAAACKPLVDQVVATGSVHRAVLGVYVQEVPRDDVRRQQIAELGGHPAIAVLQVDPDSAADHGGLCAGDMILSVDDQPVGDGPTFAAVIAARTGSTPLSVLRQGKIVALSVELK